MGKDGTVVVEMKSWYIDGWTCAFGAFGAK